MEATSLISSSPFNAPSLLSSLFPQNLNQRGMFSVTVNPQRCRIAADRKKISFCPKAALRVNVQTRVPTSVPVRVAHELHQAGHRYLDVRTPEEFSAGHVPEAINIPYMLKVGSGNLTMKVDVDRKWASKQLWRIIRTNMLADGPFKDGMTKNPNFLAEVSSHFGKYDEIIVGCQLGKRSLMAATDLLATGYTGVTDIAGGYAAWTQNRLPIE